MSPLFRTIRLHGQRHRDQTSKPSGFAAVLLLFISLYVFFGLRRLDPATQFVSFISRAGQMLPSKSEGILFDLGQPVPARGASLG
jgi:hypothetical protein